MSNTGPRDVNLNDLVVVNSPYSFYHGLTGKIVDLGPYGVMLTFTEKECARVPDQRRVLHDRETPFPYNTIVQPGEPLSERQPLLNEPNSPLPHEICGCALFGPPCGSCEYCQRCKTRVKGEVFDTHSWRHYYGSEEHQEVLGIMSRERTASNPEPCKKKAPVFLTQQLTQADTTPVKSSSKPPEPKSPVSPAGQVSLWD